MKEIQEFATKLNSFIDQLDTSINGVVSDVTALKDQIVKLQAMPPGWTPEDQKLLDDIQSRVGTLSTKVTALDGLTPPEVPAV